MPLTDEEYKKKAEAEYDPVYNQRITSINNALNQQTDTLNAQKGGINEQYDTQLDNQNRNNILTKNNYSDINTDRGLGRSTILTTGLASMDDKNGRLLGEINKARGRDLGNIDTQISTLKNNTTNTITQLGADRENSLSALIRQFRAEDEDREYKARQEQLQREQFERQKMESDRAYQLQLQQIADAKAAAAAKASSGGRSGSGSSGSTTSSKQALQSRIDSAKRSGDFDTMSALIYQAKDSIIADFGQTYWNQLEKDYQAWINPRPSKIPSEPMSNTNYKDYTSSGVKTYLTPTVKKSRMLE